ncbi:VanZ family protein [Massilimicrobiota timonensis]|uniref:VanZ family protein n=1 Tax=Massilimicrobiota timonensis TaxID=1776392 RepID=UPI001960179C|nr:VanZ family protein [Massilimicrobiota timonensis]MBM6967112.1 VanZ family protein [Massilimicrobiota timonensis]
MKKVKYFIPSMFLMILIFMFSHQTGSESSGLSSQIVLWIQTYLHIPISEFIVRKAAHMSEYALLTLTLIYGFYKNHYPIQKIMIYSLIGTFLYACSDEMHQLFIGGRAGQFTDVLIDTCGGCLTIIFYDVLTKLKYKQRR